MRVSPILFAFGALLACGPPSPSDPPPTPNTQLEGSRLAVFLPEGFARIPHQAGWVHDEQGISVMLGEGTAANEERAREWIGGYLQSVSQSRGGAEWSLRRDGPRTFFSSNDTLTHGVVFREGNAVGSVLVLLTSRDQEGLASDIVRSARLHADRSLDALGVMQVSLTPQAGLALTQATTVMAMFVPEDAEAPFPAGMPVVRVQHVILDRAYAIGELGQLVGASLRPLAPDLANAEAQQLQVDGLDALELAGEGAQDGTRIWIRAMLVVDRDEFGVSRGAFLMVAHAADHELEAPMRSMMHSLRREISEPAEPGSDVEAEPEPDTES